MEGVSRGRLIGRGNQVGFGHISIPNNVPRDKFIALCYIRERVNIWMSESPTIIRNCMITRDVLSDIEFPEKYDERGSFVIFLTHPTTGRPVVIGRIGKQYESQLLDEFSWKKQFSFGNNLAALLVNGKNGEICLTVDSDKDTGGNITINVKNKQNKGILNLNCKGKINVTASQDATVKSAKNIVLQSVSYDQFGKETTDSSLKIEKDKITVDNQKKIVLAEETSHVARAEELQKQLDILQTKVDVIIETLENAPPISTDVGVTYQSFLIATLKLVTDADFKNIASKKVTCD